VRPSWYRIELCHDVVEALVVQVIAELARRAFVLAMPPRAVKLERAVARNTLDRDSTSPVGYALRIPTPSAMFGRTNKRERCQHGYGHSVEWSEDDWIKSGKLGRRLRHL
jgi:hypothetical protein